MAKKKKKQKAKLKKLGREAGAKKSGKVAQAKKRIAASVDQINRVIGRLEREVESLVKKIVKQGERSRKELVKNFEELVARIRANDLIAFANETRDDVEREIRRLAEDIVEVVKEIERIPGRLDLGGVVHDMRRSFGDIVSQLNDSGLIQRAKETVLRTRKEVLGLLSIPTHDEVVKLERKIVNLEKRLNNINRRAA